MLLAQFLLLQYLRLQEEKEIAREVQRPFDEYKYRVFQLLCYEFCPEDLPINKVNLKKKTEVIFLSSAVPAGGGGGTHHLVSLVTGDPDPTNASHSASSILPSATASGVFLFRDEKRLYAFVKAQIAFLKA